MTEVEGLLRELAPQVLAALVRRYGGFDTCEDAVQEALVAATAQWPVQGWPENPRGWLVTVASRRLADQLRSDAARRRREEADAFRAWLMVTAQAAADAAKEGGFMGFGAEQVSAGEKEMLDKLGATLGV